MPAKESQAGHLEIGSESEIDAAGQKVGFVFDLFRCDINYFIDSGSWVTLENECVVSAVHWSYCLLVSREC